MELLCASFSPSIASCGSDDFRVRTICAVDSRECIPFLFYSMFMKKICPPYGFVGQDEPFPKVALTLTLTVVQRFPSITNAIAES